MQVSGFSSFAKARASVFLAALATSCWAVSAAAQTAAAATSAPHAKFGTWGVDLSTRDL